MRSYNRVTLMGHMANDPELRQTKNGKNLVTFSLATDRDWVDSGGEKHKKVDFHRVVAWQNLAEICEKYLVKGSAIMLDGRISNRTYEISEGDKRSITEIVADNINIITWKKSEDGGDKVSLHDVQHSEEFVAA